MTVKSIRERKTIVRTFATEQDRALWVKVLAKGIDAADQAVKWGLTDCATLGATVEPFLLDRKVNRGFKAGTVKQYRRVIERWKEQLGDIALDQITPDRVLVAVEVRLKTVSRSTAAKEVYILKSLAAFAVQDPRLVPPGVTLPVLFAKVPRSPKWSPREWMHLEELQKVLHDFKEGAPWLYRPLFFMALVGCRPASVVKLIWRDVVMPTKTRPVGSVRVKACKKGLPEVREVRLGSQLHQLLDEARTVARRIGKPARAHRSVFMTKQARRPGGGFTPKGFSESVSRVAKRLKWPRFTAYVIRHSLVSRAKEEGHSQLAIQRAFTHRSAASQEHYTHSRATSARPVLQFLEGALEYEKSIA